MILHYIKFTYRNIRSNKVIFTGSLATLCLGALCISLLFTYIHNEYTMDNFHSKKKSIYMMTIQDAPGLQRKTMNFYNKYEFKYKEYPEIDDFVKIYKLPKEAISFSYKKTAFSPEGIVVDTNFFNVFDFDLTHGNKQNILNDPDVIIITETFSKKMFGDKNPIGKRIEVGTGYARFKIVKGIVKSPPSNSSLTFDYILPSHFDSDGRKNDIGSVGFILVNKNFNSEAFIKKIKDLRNTVSKKHPKLTQSRSSIISLEAIYFNTNIKNLDIIISKKGNKKVVFILLIILFTILIISILNLSNLQIINYQRNIKKSTINIINGATKQHVVIQKIVEIFILILIATFFISIAYQFVLPPFNAFMKIKLTPSFTKIILVNAFVLLIISGFSLVFPILKTYRLSLMIGLKNNSIEKYQHSSKKMIIVLQYTLTFILLISATIVTKQLQMLLHQDLGYTSKNIIKTKLFHSLQEPPELWGLLSKKIDKDVKEKIRQEFSLKRNKQNQAYEFVNNSLKNHPDIKNFSQGYSPLDGSHSDWRPAGTTEYTTTKDLIVTPNIKNVFDFKMLEGRFFNSTYVSSSVREIVINESAKKHWGITDISKIQLEGKFWSSNGKFLYKIIGVVKDFNFEHLSLKPSPLVMFNFDYPTQDYMIEFQDGSVQSGLEVVKELNQKSNPGSTFSYSFISDEVSALYQKEKRLSTTYILFTIIALLISAIGLFTIALYDTQRRVKEIGVRKVNGASIIEILLMLNKDFIKWVGISFVIACPIAYYLMHSWLENFAYKTALSWWVFALAGGFTLVVSLITVSWQTYKAATQNPVESLRDE